MSDGKTWWAVSALLRKDGNAATKITNVLRWIWAASEHEAKGMMTDHLAETYPGTSHQLTAMKPPSYTPSDKDTPHG